MRNPELSEVLMSGHTSPFYTAAGHFLRISSRGVWGQFVPQSHCRPPGLERGERFTGSHISPPPSFIVNKVEYIPITSRIHRAVSDLCEMRRSLHKPPQLQVQVLWRAGCLRIATGRIIRMTDPFAPARGLSETVCPVGDSHMLHTQPLPGFDHSRVAL